MNRPIVSNGMLTSCRINRVTSGRSNSVISKNPSHHLCRPFLKSDLQNHTNFRKVTTPLSIAMVKELKHVRLGHVGIVDHSVWFTNTRCKKTWGGGVEREGERETEREREMSRRRRRKKKLERAKTITNWRKKRYEKCHMANTVPYVTNLHLRLRPMNYRLTAQQEPYTK